MVVCRYCKRSFKNNNSLYSHVSKYHRDINTTNPQLAEALDLYIQKSNTTETRKCRCCGKTFTNTATLASHEYRIRKRRKIELKEQVNALEKAEKDEAEENLEVEVLTPAKAASNNQKTDELENDKSSNSC